MGDIFFGRITQYPFTSLNIGNNSIVTGIPFVVTFFISDGVYPDVNVNEPQICFYKVVNERLIYNEDNTFPISTLLSKTFVIYKNNDFSFTYDNQIYYFSTLNNGNKYYYEFDPPFGDPYRRFSIVSPTINAKYKVYRYFTYLNSQNIDLNNYINVVINWSSVDFPDGNYTSDAVTLSMYNEFGSIVTLTDVTDNSKKITSKLLAYNTSLPVLTFSNIPSGNYYFKYDFVSYRLTQIPTFPLPSGIPRPDGTYTYGESSSENTSLFTFITQYLQSVSATNALPDSTSTIAINVGFGYTGYTYTLSINDENNFSIRTTFPYNYTSPSINTTLYTATVSNSSDTNDPNTRSKTFTAWKYITSISISTRIIQSSQNYLSWIGGRASESFNYNGTTITTNGSTAFSKGNKVDSSSFTPGAYPIQPSETIENNGSYSPFYFDSIAPNQRVNVVANSSPQTYTLSWTSYYTASSPAPDGTRQYTVSIYPTGPTGKSYSGPSAYNVITIPYSSVTYGVPYTIKVEDIILTTNAFFYDPPTNITITPNYVNFPNVIRWTSTTPTLNVIMNQLAFQGTPPTEQNLTESTSGASGNILFWPLGSTSSNAVVGGTYSLSANTLFLSLGTTVPIFQGIVLPFDFGEYLYPTDHFSLSLYRNGAVVKQLEASITIPFTWNPYTYEVTYQPNDQLYFKSNEHLNYGISDPFTFIANASVSVDKSVYNLDSIILATMVINVEMPTFYVQLQDIANVYEPIPIDFLRNGSQYSFNLNDISLNINMYRLNFYLTNSPTISISTQSFQVTTPVTIEAYSIYAPVIATLYVDLPTTFTVQLKDAANTQTFSLPDFDADLLSHYSFNPSTYGLTDTGYYLIFNPVGLDAILYSPSFTLVQTATISVSNQYSIYEPVTATINLGVDETVEFTIQLQDFANITPRITLEPFEVTSSGTYSFNPSDYGLTDTGYYLIFNPADVNIVFYSLPFTLVQTATISVSNQYSIYEPITATVNLGGNKTYAKFTVQLQDAANRNPSIPLDPFTVTSSGTYSFTPSTYGLTNTAYYLIFKPYGLAILDSPTFTLVQTATLTLDQSNYTIISNIIALFDLHAISTVDFSIELQDAANLLLPIPLSPSFIVNSARYYSFLPYDSNLGDTGYYFIARPVGIDIVLQSAVFQMSTNYFTLFPISTPLPEFARATTNTLCVTAKKNNVATTIISLVNNIAYASAITGKPQFLVPCGIIKYLKELNKLLITMGLRDALLLLIQKYNIPQSTPAITNQSRYKYPTVIAKVLKPILQYSSSFRLSIKATGNSVNTDIRFVEKLTDARLLTICNDDTKTFSTLYTDMLVKAPYWLNTLQPFKKDGDFTYCVVRPIQGSLKQLITASITLKNNYLIFTPVILRLVLGFYNAYGPVDIDIMFSSNSIVEILKYLEAAYNKIYLNPATAL